MAKDQRERQKMKQIERQELRLAERKRKQQRKLDEMERPELVQQNVAMDAATYQNFMQFM